MNERPDWAGRLVLAGALAALLGCGGDDSPAAKEKAATVSNPQIETALTQVKLSTEAFTRLGIRTVIADSAEVGAVRTLGGEVVVPPGDRADVVAPVAGKVIIPADVRGRLGASVAVGTPIVRLVPIPTGTDLVRTAEEVRTAEARYAQLSAEEQRVRALRNEKLVSERDLERAVADLRAAEAARDAAVARHRLIQTGSAVDTGNVEENSALTALTIASPMAGVLLNLNVGSGQVVTSGTPLFTVASLGRLWVKVSLYAGDARTIARGQRVTVHSLSSGVGGFAVSARPATAPLSADPGSSSIDLFYQLDQPRGLRPGERVSVSLPVSGPRRQALVVPLSAVLYDVAGDAWVYVRTDSLVFTRRRIEVANVVGDRVLVTRGLAPGTPVVTSGAVELFGTEFGPGK
jgi:RND family efflux transporter MFP subunit